MARRTPLTPPLPEWDAEPVYTMAKGAFARDMEVTPAAVSQWIGRGMPTREDGLLDIRIVAQWILDNLDPTTARRTRAEAYAVRRFILTLADGRYRVKQTVEAAAAAAYKAALAAGLPEDVAARLADAAAVGTVERINPELTGDTNIALPPPPAGLWRETLVEGAGASLTTGQAAAQ